MESLKMLKVKNVIQTASNPIAIKKTKDDTKVHDIMNLAEEITYSGVFKVFKSAKMQYNCEKSSNRAAYNKRKSDSSVRKTVAFWTMTMW